MGLPRLGRAGLPASCGAGEARRRPCAPQLQPPKGTIQFSTCTSTSQKFEFRGPRTAPSRQARLERAVDGSLRFLSPNSPWPWRSKYELVARCQRDARPKGLKSNWVAPHLGQKRWIALEAPSPASAAQHCSLPSGNAARGGGAETVDLARTPPPKKTSCTKPCAGNLDLNKTGAAASFTRPR